MPTQVFVFDWQGRLWDLIEAQPTKHGFWVLSGWPAGEPRRTPKPILTVDLVDYFRSTGRAATDLPLSPATVARLRAVAGAAR